MTDHRHGSLLLRGALCNHCNLALGHLFDSRVLPLSIVLYLLRTEVAEDEGDVHATTSNDRREMRKLIAEILNHLDELESDSDLDELSEFTTDSEDEDYSTDSDEAEWSDEEFVSDEAESSSEADSDDEDFIQHFGNIQIRRH